VNVVARTAIEMAMRLQPGEISSTWKRDAFVRNACTQRYFDGLRLAGMPD
jgi:hypothetical protein